MTLLLLAAVAGSQQPVPQTVPAAPRPRPHRVVHAQPHLEDPWYPDPPAEGGSPQPSPAAQPAPTAPGTASAMTPAQAPQAAPMQQMIDQQLPPATAPQVAFRDGQLTVRAINSTLESVLSAIRNKAGIQFEGLEGAPERVAISMGPLPEGEVLAAVLAGSHYDFIVVERPDSPGIVQRVLLSPRRGSASASAAAPGMTGTQPASRPASGDEDETPDETSVEAESPQDTPARPPIMQAQPQMQINPQPQQPQPGQQPTTPKTPEQLLEELKQMQQRQQQQQPPPQQQAPLKQPPL